MTKRSARARYEVTRLLVAAAAAGAATLGWAIIAAAGPRTPLADPAPPAGSAAFVAETLPSAGLSSTSTTPPFRGAAPVQRHRTSRGS
jgi:hypothetical protein